MEETMELFCFETDLNVFVMEYDNNYFEDDNEVISHIVFFLDDFVEYRKSNESLDLLDFIKWNIQNNLSVNDWIEERGFSLSYFKRKIEIKEDNRIKSFSYLAQIDIEEYCIHISNYYLFIENTNDKKSYMYYLD